MTDNEILREAIELFAVQHFDTIEMSGTVKQETRKNINYFSLDLNNKEWDGDIEKLHHSLSKYLTEWARQNMSGFSNYVAISNITIEYLLPEKDGVIQNKSKHLTLFYLPSYYFHDSKEEGRRSLSNLKLWVLNIWYNIILRNIIIVSIPTILLVVLSIIKVDTDLLFRERLSKAFDYVNVASGIIASFVLGFLINKAITIRQDKLKRTKKIKRLSNQLTYFRNICYRFLRDHNYWAEINPAYKAYQHGNSIKNKITYKEYYYPNYNDDVEYAKYKSLYNENVSHSVVTLVLQLHMMADDSFLNSGLSYTQFPPNYIYSHSEMEKFIMFSDSNSIWYCSSEVKIFPDTFQSSYAVKGILEDIKRIYPNKKGEKLTSDLFEEVSLDFQYRFIPSLYNLTKLNESDLPITLRYFIVTFILLLVFGLIIPTLTYIFFDKTYAFINVFIVIGIVSHILLSLGAILNTENTLDRKNDYL